jgi:hypothetical protein
MAPKRLHAEVDIDHLNANTSAKDTRSYTTRNYNPEDPDERHDSLSPNGRHHLDRSDADTSLDPAGSSRKRSEPVKSACGQCQRRKTKCSGQRPTCRFCSDRGLDCSWDIGDGLTRNADLRQRLAEANSYSVDINMLVYDMRTNTDAVATTLLAKLRLGDSIEDLATGIRDGTSFMDDGTYTQGRRLHLQIPDM